MPLVPWTMWLLSGIAVSHAAPTQVRYTVFPAVAAQSTVEAPEQRSADSARVSLDARDSTLEYVIRSLVHQAGRRVAYDGDNPVFKRRVTVHVIHTGLMTSLAIVLKGTGLAASVASDSETIVVSVPTPGSTGSGRRHVTGGNITGRITDSASGHAVSRVTVKVAGVNLSTVTADDGRFTLRGVPVGDHALTARLFGYRPVTQPVTVVDSQTTTVSMVMVRVATVLSGVITTAIGEQQRYQVGNDITVLNADSVQRIAPVSTLTDMLETRVPGLIVQRTSGIPGAPSRLRLRGISSINSSSDPILIVDGIRVYSDQSGGTNPQSMVGRGNAPGDSAVTTSGGGSRVVSQTPRGGDANTFAGPSALDQIDPNSIETIEVLKGPSATAIYGSDAGAGVIVITTKRGHAGPTHWNLSLNQGMSTLPGSWPINYYRFGSGDAFTQGIPNSQLCSYANRISGELDNTCLLDSIVAFQALNDPRYSPLTGRPGYNQDVSLTVSGGNGQLTYAVTGTASSQRGYLHLPAIEQERFQASHGFAVPDWMKTPDQLTTYGENSSLTIALGREGTSLTLSDALWRSQQQQSSLNNDLNALAITYVDTSQARTTPLFPDAYIRAQLATTTFTNAVTLTNWRPWTFLPLTATVGVNTHDINNTTLLPRDYINCQDYSASADCGLDSLGRYGTSQGSDESATFNVGTIVPSRVVNTAVGINVYTEGQRQFGAQTIGLPIGVTVPNQFLYDQNLNPGGPSYSTSNTATYGWYVQPTLNFGNRFWVSPGFRFDGGSNAGANSGIGGGGLSPFPKLDFSWIALQRAPEHALFGLTLLRPRVALGIAGVQPGPAETLRLLTPGQVQTSTTTLPVDILSITSLGNTQLRPERDRELEGGLDAQFWNDRMELTLTGYRKMAYDAILAIPTAPSVSPLGGGSGNVDRNVGNIRNTGGEATVFARLVDTRRMAWSINANLSKNTNTLVSLAMDQPPITVQSGAGYEIRLSPGYPVFGLWARPIAGFADADHNGFISPDEVVIGDSARFVGASLPNYEVTASTTLSLWENRVTINTSIDYQNGLTQVRPFVNSAYDFELNNPNITQTQLAAYAAAVGPPSNATAIGFMQTVNTLRWNTMSVNYVFPTGVAHFFRVNLMSVSFQGSNLALHTNYRGKDPNVNAYSSGNQSLDDGSELPQPRMWDVRITLGN